jgi:hypothetical protein
MVGVAMISSAPAARINPSKEAQAYGLSEVRDPPSFFERSVQDRGLAAPTRHTAPTGALEVDTGPQRRESLRQSQSSSQ